MIQRDPMPRHTSLNQLIQTTKDLESKSTDLAPLMAHIANLLQTTTSEAFEKESSPFGQKWAKLSPNTLKRHKAGKKKLVDKGKLVHSIHTRHTHKSASIGTNVSYAAIHQFGGIAGRNKSVQIKPRAFLPINKKGAIPKNLKYEIKEMVVEYLLGDIKDKS